MVAGTHLCTHQGDVTYLLFIYFRSASLSREDHEQGYCFLYPDKRKLGITEALQEAKHQSPHDAIGASTARVSSAGSRPAVG